MDAYDEDEQATGMHCVIEEWGSLPCSVVVVAEQGTLVDVELREAFLVGLVQTQLEGDSAL